MHEIIKPEDEQFHDVHNWPGYDPAGPKFFNESGLFMFGVPERDLSAWVYVQHRPDMGFTWCGMAIWDTSGHLTTDCLHYSFMYYKTPPGSQVWDFEIPNAGLKIAAPEPLQRYELRYDKDGVQASLEFNAIIPPVGQEVPGNWTDWCPRHYDHIGRMTGELVVQGERIPVDSFCCRDRSWGPHSKDKLARGSYMWGIASEEQAFIGYVLSDLAPEEDPYDDGTVEDVKGGWHMKDGKVGAIVRGERRTARGDDTRPLKEFVEAVDEHGRNFVLEGTAKNHLLFTGFPEYPWWWTSIDWTMDGTPAIGETQDAAITKVFRRGMRKANAAKLLQGSV
jgi:hypothetical protein